MDCKRFPTAEGGNALSRRFAICMLSVGLVAWAVPLAPQDGGASSPCANGIAVPDPEDHPALVADCEVLMAIDQLAGGPFFGWSTDVPITKWHGIEIRDGRVTGLRAESSGEFGLFPLGPILPELSQLTKQEVLFLVNTEVTGPIPPELGRLSELRELILEGNPFLTGSIPPELGQLTNLRMLDLDDIPLNGPDPTGIGSIDKFEGAVHPFQLPVNGADSTGVREPEGT